LLVLALVGLSAVIVLPALQRGFEERELRATARRLAAAARDLRSLAIRESRLEQMVFNAEERSYEVGSKEKIYLPRTVTALAVDGGEVVGPGRTRFLFFPNGSLVGGTVEIASEEGSSYRLRLEPLLGRIDVARGP
jgi:general secretion pathway protein H